MARGLDKENPANSPPPRRNPFRQEIKSEQEIKKEERETSKTKEQKQESEKAQEAIQSGAPLPSINVDPERVALLGGLPLSILDPLNGAQGFDYILDPERVENLMRTPLRSGFEFVSWRDPLIGDENPLSEQRGILYQMGEPLALVTYDEMEEAYILYAQDPYSGQAQALIDFPTTEPGFLGRLKEKRSYQRNPGRALAQDINDFLEAVELGQALADNPFPSAGQSLYGPATIAAGVILSASQALPYTQAVDNNKR